MLTFTGTSYTRYRVSDCSQLTDAGMDWSMGVSVRMNGASFSGGAYSYTGDGSRSRFSLNAGGGSPSTANNWYFNFANFFTLWSADAPGNDGIARYIIIQNKYASRTMEMWFADRNGASLQGSYNYGSGTSLLMEDTTNSLDIGTSGSDVLGGDLGHFFRINNLVLSSGQISALGKGFPLQKMNISPDLYFPMQAPVSNQVDIYNGIVADNYLGVLPDQAEDFHTIVPSALYTVDRTAAASVAGIGPLYYYSKNDR